MLLEADLPSLITNHSDFEPYINALNRWNADDSKHVSPIFPGDLLEFTTRLVYELSLYIKQQDNPVSPTVADSDQQDHTLAQFHRVSYSNSREAHFTTNTMPSTSDGLQSNAERSASNAKECKDISSQVSGLEAYMSSIKDNFRKAAEIFNCLKQCLEHVDGKLESGDYSSAAVCRKRKRTKTEEPMDPACLAA